MKQVDFTVNLGGNNSRVMFSISEEAKKTILGFP